MLTKSGTMPLASLVPRLSANTQNDAKKAWDAYAHACLLGMRLFISIHLGTAP